MEIFLLNIIECLNIFFTVMKITAFLLTVGVALATVEGFPRKNLQAAEQPNNNIFKRILEEWVGKLEEEANMDSGLLERRKVVSMKQ